MRLTRKRLIRLRTSWAPSLQNQTDMRPILAFLLLAAAGCTHHELTEQVQYRWDGASVICSKVVDDIAQHDGLVKIVSDLDYARDHKTAAVMHAHVPLATISLAELLCIFDIVRRKGIELVTFSELEARKDGPPALALSFDDADIDAWYQVREVFAANNAHVTFFVTAYESFSDTQKAKLAELAAMGNDIEAHGMYHLNAVDFVADHSIDQYLNEEVLPSIALLQQDGFPISTFAFPFGATDDAITDAVLEHVRQVRVTRSACPY
jgi:hypothetical protein